MVFVNVENDAYWEKLFRHEFRLKETPGTLWDKRGLSILGKLSILYVLTLEGDK